MLERIWIITVVSQRDGKLLNVQAATSESNATDWLKKEMGLSADEMESLICAGYCYVGENHLRKITVTSEYLINDKMI